jgi:hypothetical protein
MQTPAEVCKSLQKYARACKSLHKYSKAYSKQKQISKSKYLMTTFSRLFSNFMTTSHLFQILWRLFPAFAQIWDNFSKIKFQLFDINKMTFYLFFCFVCYAVQSLSRLYKTLSPFLGGGVKAIPRTALLLSKIGFSWRIESKILQAWKVLQKGKLGKFSCCLLSP